MKISQTKRKMLLSFTELGKRDRVITKELPVRIIIINNSF